MDCGGRWGRFGWLERGWGGWRKGQQRGCALRRQRHTSQARSMACIEKNVAMIERSYFVGLKTAAAGHEASPIWLAESTGIFFQGSIHRSSRYNGPDCPRNSTVDETVRRDTS